VYSELFCIGRWLCGHQTKYDGPSAIHDTGCCPERDWSHTYVSSAVAPIVSQVLARPLEEADFVVMERVSDDREPTDYPWDLAARAVDLIRERDSR